VPRELSPSATMPPTFQGLDKSLEFGLAPHDILDVIHIVPQLQYLRAVRVEVPARAEHSSQELCLCHKSASSVIGNMRLSRSRVFRLPRILFCSSLSKRATHLDSPQASRVPLPRHCTLAQTQLVCSPVPNERSKKQNAHILRTALLAALCYSAAAQLSSIALVGAGKGGERPGAYGDEHDPRGLPPEVTLPDDECNRLVAVVFIAAKTP
jgi:hypothetical protein